MVVSLDCAAFKRDCGADPQGVAERVALSQHTEKCPDCAEFHQEMLALDQQLSAAFALPVAQDSLEEQLSKAKLAQPEKVVALSGARTKSQRYAWFAAAASVMLAALLFIRVPDVGNVAIADEVIGHIYHEPGLIVLTKAITDDDEVQMVLKQANIEMKSKDMKILAAKLCPLNGQLAAHLVVQGVTGTPVTVLIMPGKDIGNQSTLIESNEFNGRILTAEHGAMAVVGGKKENIEQMEQQVNATFQWLD